MKNFLTTQTQEQAKKLVESVSKAELIDFICNCDSSYTTGTAENFLENLKNKENSWDVFHKWAYTEFVFGVVAYWMLHYWYDFERIAREELERYKSCKIHQAGEDAKKWRLEARRTEFRCLMIDFYKWTITEEEAKKQILWNYAEDSRYAKNSKELKTLNKIKAKKETKSHNLSKILKLIEEDIARWYGDRMNITDEQKEHANKIEKSHGFITRW